MIMEEPVSADDGPYAPSAPSVVRDSNLSASVSGQLPVGLGFHSASATGQLPVGVDLGSSSALASGQLPVGVGLGFRPASQLLPGPLAGQRERGLPRSSGDSGSAGQLERSYLRLSPGMF